MANISVNLQSSPREDLPESLLAYGLWLLRLALGTVLLTHVMSPLFGYLPPDVAQLFALPPGVSPLVIAAEALAAVALLLGLWPRAAALLGAATLLAGMVAGAGAVTDPVFGWAHPVPWSLALTAFALLGDGAFAVIPTPFRFSAGARP